MKLQLEITNVEHASSRVTLKPINCALKGDLIYTIPRRAAEMCHVGDAVEATIPLPDQYPINDGANCYLDEPLTKRHHGWRSIQSAPAGVWVLVSAGVTTDPGGMDVVIARLIRTNGIDGYWQPAFGGGAYQGAKYWQPLPEIPKECAI